MPEHPLGPHLWRESKAEAFDPCLEVRRRRRPPPCRWQGTGVCSSQRPLHLFVFFTRQVTTRCSTNHFRRWVRQYWTQGWSQSLQDLPTIGVPPKLFATSLPIPEDGAASVRRYYLYLFLGSQPESPRGARAQCHLIPTVSHVSCRAGWLHESGVCYCIGTPIALRSSPSLLVSLVPGS